MPYRDAELNRAAARNWNREHRERANETLRRFRARQSAQEKEIERLQSKAHHRAMADLRERHRAEFEALYAEWRARLGI